LPSLIPLGLLSPVKCCCQDVGESLVTCDLYLLGEVSSELVNGIKVLVSDWIIRDLDKVIVCGSCALLNYLG
jgi:hypothetical protein